MTNEEYDKLIEERDLIKMLLDFHLSHPEIWEGDQKSFEEYINAALDRILEINQILNESSPTL